MGGNYRFAKVPSYFSKLSKEICNFYDLSRPPIRKFYNEKYIVFDDNEIEIEASFIVYKFSSREARSPRQERASCPDKMAGIFPSALVGSTLAQPSIN